MTILSATTLYIILIEVALAFSVIKLLKQNHSGEKTIKIAFGIFSIWLLTTLSLLGENSILPSNISSFNLFVIILITIAISGIFLSPLFKDLIALPQEFLLLPQAFRMFFGAGFIIEAVFEIMPIGYGVIDGILHISTAFLATTFAIYIAHGEKFTKSLIMINLFGLLDIVIVAYGIAFFILDDIGVQHNVFYAVFFPAPLFIWLHLISLYKIYKPCKISAY